MWYVIRVDSGRENEACFFIETIIDMEKFGRVFIPKVVKKRKYREIWHDRYLPFIPGYVFFETDDPLSLFFELKKVPRRTSLLRIDDEILAVKKEEEAFIRSFFGTDDVIEVSIAHKEGDQVVIDSGPLTGREAEIRKIDSHKRTAVVSTEMFGRTMELKVGIEVLPQKTV